MLGGNARERWRPTTNSRSITREQTLKDHVGFTCAVCEGIAKRGVDDAEEDALRQARNCLGPALVQLPQGSETSELSKRERQHYLPEEIRGKGEVAVAQRLLLPQRQTAAADTTKRGRFLHSETEWPHMYTSKASIVALEALTYSVVPQ